MRAQKPQGSVVFNKARGTWNFLWVGAGKRRSRKLGTLAELPTRPDALRKAENVRRELRLLAERTIITVNQLVQQYRVERSCRIRHDRHTYRTWLDSVGTPVGVQQKLMRHADIRTTMNIYGDVVTPDMREAHVKIVGLALNGLQADCKPS